MKSVPYPYLLLLASIIVSGLCLFVLFRWEEPRQEDLTPVLCSEKTYVHNVPFLNQFEPLLSEGHDMSKFTVTAVRINEDTGESENKTIDIYSEQYFNEVKHNNSKPYESIFNNNLDDKPSIPGFKNMLTSMRLSSNYKLASCAVPKTMSTLMAAIQCYLRYPGKSFANYPYCDKEISVESVHHGLLKQNLTSFDGWKLIFIKRDPLDRFLSGFMDRCVRVGRKCFGCYSNVQCFLERLYQSFEAIVADRDQVSYDEYHLAPQTWNCELPRNWRNIRFIRYSSDPTETLLEDLMPIMDELNIPTHQKKGIWDGLTSLRTSHSTVDSPIRAYMEEKVKSSPYMYKLLKLIYESDYKLLGFDQ